MVGADVRLWSVIYEAKQVPATQHGLMAATPSCTGERGSEMFVRRRAVGVCARKSARRLFWAILLNGLRNRPIVADMEAFHPLRTSVLLSQLCPLSIRTGFLEN